MSGAGPDALLRAAQLIDRGRLREAEPLVLATLRETPDLRAAWTLRARLALELKNYDEAWQHIQRAMTDSAGDSSAYCVLARILNARSQLSPALRAFRRAIDLEPASAEAWTGLGSALRSAGQLVSAADAYRRALMLAPDNSVARYSLDKLRAKGGNSDARSKPTPAALALIRQADDLGQASANEFNAGAYRRALDISREGLQLAPDAEGLLHVAARSAAALGGRSEAFLYFDHLARVPNRSTEGLYGAFSLAAISGEPDRVERYASVLVRAEKDRGNIAMLRHAAALTLPAIQDSRASIAECRLGYGRALDELRAQKIRLQTTVAVPAVTSFFLAYHGENDRELQCKAAELYAQSIPSLSFTAEHCRETRRRPGRIRVGFISNFFHAHSIGKTSRGLIEKLDRERFEVIVISIVPSQRDATTNAIRTAADRFVDVDWATSPAAVHAKIAALQLDVLFYQDIGMEPVGYFLAFARLAPVQCVSYGHPNTTGIPTIDYFVSNDLYETERSHEHYSETLFELSDLPTLAYYYRPQAPSRVRSRAELGLPESGALYLCPQALFKIHPDFDEVLRGILGRDPDGHVILIRGRYEAWYEQLHLRFETALGGLSRRIVALDPMAGPLFMELLAAGDVMLDPLHFNGMNSSLEAFSVDLPVVTLPTGLQRGRHTRAMYVKMGIDDCVADDVNSYVDIAVRLGTEPDFNCEIRRRIRESSAVLFEDQRVVREFERFFHNALVSKGVAI